MTLAFDQRRRSRHFQHPPPSDSRGGLWISRLDYGSLSLRPADLLALLSELTESPQSTRTFTSGLPTDWSPAPPPDMTTVATGQVPLTGLSPARVPTSIAAAPLPSFSERDSPTFLLTVVYLGEKSEESRTGCAFIGISCHLRFMLPNNIPQVASSLPLPL